MKTGTLILIPHFPSHLIALIESSDAYEEISGMRVAAGVREFLLAGSPDFPQQLESATDSDPWKFGFSILHTIDNVVIGMCGFAGPPDAEGTVEIAYSIAPAYQGKGYATEAAMALVEFASNSGIVRTVRAHTLAELNVSTGVLERCDFKKIGEIVDAESNLVWRWERNLHAPSIRG